MFTEVVLQNSCTGYRASSNKNRHSIRVVKETLRLARRNKTAIKTTSKIVLMLFYSKSKTKTNKTTTKKTPSISFSKKNRVWFPKIPCDVVIHTTELFITFLSSSKVHANTQFLPFQNCLYLRLMHLLANSAFLLTLVHCALLQDTQKSMANVPFHTLHLLSGTIFLKLFETQNLLFLSNPP